MEPEAMSALPLTTFARSAATTSSAATLPAGPFNRRSKRAFTDPLYEYELGPEHAIRREGISQATAFVGTLFAFSVVFIFGRYPEHSWLFLLGGQVVLSGMWYYHAVRYRRGRWFLVDFSWFATAVIFLYLVFVWCRWLNEHYLEMGFRTMFMLSAGFLSFCTIGFDDSVVFYSYQRLTSLFIHLMPLATLLSMREGSDRLSESLLASWPGYFPENVWPDTQLHDLLLAAYVPYLIWFLPHSAWLICYGVDLPARGCCTTFSEVYVRRLQESVAKRMGNVNLRCHAVFWMISHFFCASATFAYACIVWYVLQLHYEWVAILFLCAVWAGADHYIRISLMHFGPLMKKRDEEANAKSAAMNTYRSEKKRSEQVEMQPPGLDAVQRAGTAKSLGSQPPPSLSMHPDPSLPYSKGGSQESVAIVLSEQGGKHAVMRHKPTEGESVLLELRVDGVDYHTLMQDGYLKVGFESSIKQSIIVKVSASSVQVEFAAGSVIARASVYPGPGVSAGDLVADLEKSQQEIAATAAQNLNDMPGIQAIATGHIMIATISITKAVKEPWFLKPSVGAWLSLLQAPLPMPSLPATDPRAVAPLAIGA